MPDTRRQKAVSLLRYCECRAQGFGGVRRAAGRDPWIGPLGALTIDALPSHVMRR
jgi:hypothetical protein